MDVYPWRDEPHTRHRTDDQLLLDGRIARDHTHSGLLHPGSTGMVHSPSAISRADEADQKKYSWRTVAYSSTAALL